MKYLIVYLLVPVVSFCQQLTANQQKVLEIEFNLLSKEYKTFGDTLLIYRQAIADLDEPLAVLKERLIANNEFTIQEANDIFGTDSIPKFSLPKITEWREQDFKNHNVKLIETQSQGVNKAEISEYKHFISAPLIRHDNKYALIFHGASDEGGYLDIFIYINKKWQFFRSIELFVI